MRYLPSAFIGQLAGTMGCTVATHSRYSSFFRNRVMPVNPKTPAQTLVRDLMTSLSQNWKGLSNAQQQAWSQLANTGPRRNIQGKQIMLTGHAFYLHLNLFRNQVDLARIDVAPPAIETPPSFTDVTNVINGTGAILTINPTVIDRTATNFITVWATPPISPGINFVGQSDYRLLTFFAANVFVPVTILAAYEAVFGAGWQTFVGMKIGIRIQGISDSGFDGKFIESLQLII